MLSVAYDVLNNIAIDSLLRKAYSNERTLALEHIKNLYEENKTKENKIQENKTQENKTQENKTQERNLLLFDRGYFSLEMFLNLKIHDMDFVFRMPRNSYKEIVELFEKKSDIHSKVVHFTL